MSLATQDALVQSPFRVKGLMYLQTKPYFDAQVSGGYEALLAALRPALREFMQQPFVPGGTYEVVIVPELVDAEARVARRSVAAYLEARSRWQAERDLGGVYQLIVRVAPVRVAVQRMFVLMTQMFNFGTPKFAKQSNGILRVEICGVPSLLAAWLQAAICAYAQTCLELTGAKNARVTPLGRVHGEPVTGYPAETLCFEVRWAAGLQTSEDGASSP